VAGRRPVEYGTGMTAEHFQTTVRALRRRTPFKPYVVELVSGDRVQVDHPEALVIRGGVAVFVNVAGAPVIFDHEGVGQVFADSADAPPLRMGLSGPFDALFDETYSPSE
jgi:hypothetical protein